MILYKIANWSTVYETAASRKLHSIRYICTPNKHDGLGFRRMAAQKNAAELFAAWCLIAQIASKGRRDERGKLDRDGVPLDASDLAAMTGFPAEIFDRALLFFSDPKMGWLNCEQVEVAGEMLPGFIGNPPSSANVRRDRTEQPPQTATQREGKEREEKEREGRGRDSLLMGSPAFLKVWRLYEKHREEIRKPLTPTSARVALERLESFGESRAVECLRFTLERGATGLIEKTGAESSRSPAAIPEPEGWREFVNHNYPSSIYADGNARASDKWHQLDRDAQSKFSSEMKRQ